MEAKRIMVTEVSDELQQLSNEILETLLREGGIKVKTKAKDLPTPRKKRKRQIKDKLHELIEAL